MSKEFIRYRHEVFQIARELGYTVATLLRIQTATTYAEVDRAMVTAREAEVARMMAL